MTIGTQSGDAITEGVRPRALNVMHAMTVGAGGDIRVASRQRYPMDTRLVGIEDGAMALSTGQGDSHPRFLQKLARTLICEACLGMWIMAIGADGSIGIPSRQGVLMDTIERALVLIGMALLASGIQLQGEITRAGRSHFGVWEPSDVRMAIDTGNSLRSMHRGFECTGVDREGNRLSPDLSSHTFLLMTCQTRFVSGLITLELRRRFCGCCRENEYSQEKERSEHHAG